MKFKGPEHALRWAFAMSSKAHYASIDLFKSRSTDPSGMTIYDAHAQAALFIRQLNELPQQERAAMYASFSTGPQRRAMLTHLAVVLTDDGVSKDLSRDCLSNIITRRPQVRSIAKKNAVSYRQVIKVRKKMESRWLPIYLRAIDQLSDRWSDHFRP